jgi:hypothetical protein
MKKVLFILTFVFTISLSFGQETQKVEAKTIDTKLVGSWKGSEKDQQQKGLTKYWVAYRFEDGKITILFVAIDKKGKVIQQTETGRWWIENGKYYELHNYDNVTDIYDYEVIDNSIKFTGVDVMGDENTKYTYFDYKIEED